MNITLYRDILHEAPFGYGYHKILLDENGIPVDYVFLEVNKAFETLTGLKRENILSKKITDIMPGIRDEFDWIKFYGEVALNQSKKEFEQFSATLNKWYKVQTYSPEKFYFITLFTDITNEKMQKQELENFFDINLDLLCIADTDGNFIKVNKSWEQTLGYTTEELREKKFLDFIHPDDLESTYQAISRLSRQEQILNFVNRYRCKDGSYRFIEWRSQPMGKLIYAAARDITERKNVEISLRFSEEKNRALLSAIPDLIFILDINGIFQDNISNNADQLYVSKDLFIGKNITDVLPQTVADIALPALKSVIRNNTIEKIEYSLPFPAGNKWFEMRMVKMNEEQIMAIAQDITIRKITEESLHLRESYLSAIIENQPGLVWLKDSESKFLAVNKAFAISCGKQEPELLVGLTDYDIWPEELAEKYRKDDFDVLKMKMPRMVEEPIFDKEETRWFETFKTPVFEKNGVVIGTTGYAHDITERKLAAEALRISENRLSSILNSMEEAVYSINISNLIYIFMSPSIKKICGRSHEEFLKDFELYKKSIHPEDEPIYNSAMDSLYINGYAEIEYRVIHTDGIIRWVHDRLKIIIDDNNNKPVRIDGMIYDITQRVHAENESRQLIQAIEQSSNAIVITSAEREILYVNSAYGEMTGFPITDIIGEKICSLLPEDNEEIRSAFTEGKKWQGEIQNVRNDFTEYWARINITPVKNSNNQLTAFIILQEDISQEKIAEKEKEELLSKLQKKNFELIRLNNEKNQLLGMAAHDLRSPISVVQMYSNYILDFQSENLTKEQKSFLETIHSTSRAMNKLLSDVLDISKIESGKIDLSLELNDLNSLLKNNISLNALFAEKKNIKIRYQLEESLVKFYFDMNKIEQVLNNLIGNAIKFSHSGTSIQVVSKITGENVVIDIMDQGQGIPEEEMPRLFEAFKKLSPRPTGGEESTGLGLAIVKRLIEAHEGSISAQSKVGIGTKFTITLPYRLKI